MISEFNDCVIDECVPFGVVKIKPHPFFVHDLLPNRNYHLIFSMSNTMGETYRKGTACGVKQLMTDFNLF